MDHHFDLGLFVTAAGLAFVFEGLPYFLFPDKMPAVLRSLAEQPPRTLRRLGLLALCCGLLLVYLARRGG